MSSASEPHASRAGRIVIRLLLLLVVGAAVAYGVMTIGARSTPDTRLAVEVLVRDQRGEPVAGARVQATFAPGWIEADGEGRARLPDVPLRADEAATPESIAAALQVEAAMHAARTGRPPQVVRDEDGAWEATFVLEAFGRLQLRVAPTHAQGVRAWVEAPGRPRAVEAASGVALARPDQPATWLTFDAEGELLVCVEGFSGTAARRMWVPSPPFGMTREIELEVETASPIQGRVETAFGDAPPTLGGLLEVHGIDDQGRSVPYPSVKVEDDGRFDVAYAGEGSYRLTPRLAFVEADPVTTQGGADVGIRVSGLRPWIVIPVAEWGTRAALAEVRCVSLPDERPAHLEQGLATEADAWRIALPAAGRYRLTADTRGSSGHAPAHGEALVEARGPGAHVAAISLEPVPKGEVAVTIRPRPDRRQGATVTLLEPSRRTATVFPRISAEARFPNVRAGRVLLEIAWRDPDAAPLFLVGRLDAEGTLAVEANAVEGGLLAVVPSVHAGGHAPSTATLAWEAGASPHTDAAGQVGLIRLAGNRNLHATSRLLPGRYAATLTGEALGPVRLEFEIREGELTTVQLSRP